METMERIREARVGPLSDVAEDVRPVLRASPVSCRGNAHGGEEGDFVRRVL